VVLVEMVVSEEDIKISMHHWKVSQELLETATVVVVDHQLEEMVILVEKVVNGENLEVILVD
jgi:hypothetical protein